MLKIAIIAGEPSGDRLAATMMMELAKLYSDQIEFFGVGGSQMQELGLKSYFPMEVLSIGGFGLDVIRAIPKILWLRYKVINAIKKFNPDVFIGVDAPDFNLYVEKKLKQSGIKTVHYISPTIWAWRYERIYKIKKAINLMLCIFPMEEQIYSKEQTPAKFVGHPLANSIEMDIDKDFYRKKLGILANDGDVFTILVGSRKGEVNRLGQIFIDSCKLIAKKYPGALFLFPVANLQICRKLEELLMASAGQLNYRVLYKQTTDAIKTCNMVLAKSGTVTLEVALSKKPMIVSYKVSKLTEWIVRRKLKIQYVAQPNILLNEMVVPEILQDDATADRLASEFVNLYQNQQACQEIYAKFYQLHKMLKTESGNIAAIAIKELLS